LKVNDENSRIRIPGIRNTGTSKFRYDTSAGTYKYDTEAGTNMYDTAAGSGNPPENKSGELAKSSRVESQSCPQEDDRQRRRSQH